MANIPAAERWDKQALATDLRILIARGLTVDQAAEQLGTSRATAYRALR